MELENKNNKILDDLDKRNRNWDKLDGVPEKVEELDESRQTLTNLIENGDFSDGTVGWVFGQLSSQMIATDGIAKMGSRYVSYSPYFSVNIEKNKKYFVSSKIKNETLTLGAEPSFALTNGNGNLSERQHMGSYFNEININNFSRVSRVVTANNNYSSVALIKYTANLSYVCHAYFDDLIFVNLTDTFGAGNEPTKEEMDIIMDTIGYFNGTHTITSKEQFNILLKMVRENALATTSLGGGF